jgi:RNA polymerase sigma-70 factor, ECF subfamily
MEQLLENFIEGCRLGNAAHQQQLYRYCFQPMMKVCLRYHKNMDDAAASYNTAMHNVLTKINQYQSKGAFMGWVQKIMVNTCLNDLKANTKFEAKEITDKEYNAFLIVPSAYSNIESKVLLKMVQALPTNTCMVFNMYVLEGYTHEQIAETLDISIGTSKWHLNNARTILKNNIQNTQLYENRKNA